MERGEYSRSLRFASVTHVPFEVCRNAYRDISFAAKVLPGMICAGREGQI